MVAVLLVWFVRDDLWHAKKQSIASDPVPHADAVAEHFDAVSSYVVSFLKKAAFFLQSIKTVINQYRKARSARAGAEDPCPRAGVDPRGSAAS